MARTVDVTVPVEKTEALLNALKDIDGIERQGHPGGRVSRQEAKCPRIRLVAAG